MLNNKLFKNLQRKEGVKSMYLHIKNHTLLLKLVIISILFGNLHNNLLIAMEKTEEQAPQQEGLSVVDNQLTIDTWILRNKFEQLEEISRTTPTIKAIKIIRGPDRDNPSNKYKWKITATSLKELARIFPTITHLSLDNTFFRNFSVAPLAESFPNLRSLSLNNNGELKTLEPLRGSSLARNLTFLSLANTGISPSALAELQTIFPNAVINFDPNTTAPAVSPPARKHALELPEQYTQTEHISKLQSSSSSSSSSSTSSSKKRRVTETPEKLKELIKEALDKFFSGYEATRIPAVRSTSPQALRAHQSLIDQRKKFIASSIATLRALLRQYHQEAGRDLNTLNTHDESLIEKTLQRAAWELLQALLEIQPELLNSGSLLERTLSRDVLLGAPAIRRIPLLKVIIRAAINNNKLDEVLGNNLANLRELVDYADDNTLKTILRTLPSNSPLRAQLQAIDPSRTNGLIDAINQEEQEEQMRILVQQLPTIPTGAVNLARNLPHLPITRKQAQTIFSGLSSSS